MSSDNPYQNKKDEDASQKPFIAPQLMKNCLNMFSQPRTLNPGFQGSLVFGGNGLFQISPPPNTKKQALVTFLEVDASYKEGQTLLFNSLRKSMIEIVTSYLQASETQMLVCTSKKMSAKIEGSYVFHHQLVTVQLSGHLLSQFGPILKSK